MCNLVALSTFTLLCSHHYHRIPERFHHPKRKLGTVIKESLPNSPFPSSWQPVMCFLSLWICLFWIFHTNRMIPFMAFCGQCLSLGTVFSRFIPTVASFNTVFFLWLNNISFYAYTTRSYLFCWLMDLLPIVSSASMNIHVSIFAWKAGWNSLSEITGSCGNLC